MELELRRYLEVVCRRWKLVAGATLVSAATALVVSLLMPPVYRAHAGVVISRVRPQVVFEPTMVTLSDEKLGTLRVDTDARQNTLVALVTSPAVEAEVIQSLGDSVVPELGQPGALLTNGIAGRLAKGELIEISLRGSDPRSVTLIVNAWAEAYASYVNRLYCGTTEAPESVQSQADAARAKYEAAQNELVAFVGNNELTRLRSEIESKKDTLSYHYGIVNRTDKLVADCQGLLDQVVQAGSSEAGQVANGLSLLRLQAAIVGTGVGNPFDVQLTVDSGAGLLGDADDLRNDIQTMLRLLEAQRGESQGIIDDSSLVQDILELERDLEEEEARERELKRARSLAWDTYAALARKADEASVASQTLGSEVKFAVPAIQPRSPVGPRKVLNTVVAGALGLILGVLAAFGMEYFAESD